MPANAEMSREISFAIVRIGAMLWVFCSEREQTARRLPGRLAQVGILAVRLRLARAKVARKRSSVGAICLRAPLGPVCRAQQIRIGPARYSMGRADICALGPLICMVLATDNCAPVRPSGLLRARRSCGGSCARRKWPAANQVRRARDLSPGAHCAGGDSY